MSIPKLEPKLIKLVTETVEDIAKLKGYMTYPKQAEVELVLTALLIVNDAARRMNSGTKSGRTKSKTQ